MTREEKDFFCLSKRTAQNPGELLHCSPDFSNPDPFVLRYLGMYYCYSTGEKGVNLFTSRDMVCWEYRGLALQVEGQSGYWAPSVLYREGKFYMYYSSCQGEEFEWMRVASSDDPLGPFLFQKNLSSYFAIDTHAIRGEDGEYYLFYCTDNAYGNCLTRPGTSVLVDRLIDPFTLEERPEWILVPTVYQEISGERAVSQKIDWHTVEGVFYLRHRNQEYLLYSGNSFEREDYFLGYAVPSREAGSVKEKGWRKYPGDTVWRPFCKKEGAIEGTGHNSVAKAPNLVDDWCIYHARLMQSEPKPHGDRRLLFTDRILWDRGEMWLAGPTYEKRDAPGLPSFEDTFQHGIDQWEKRSGDWRTAHGSVLQTASNIPARLRTKEAFKEFVLEVWLKTDPQPHGSLLGVSLSCAEETIDFLLHEGLCRAEIVRWRNGVRWVEKEIPLERGYAPFAWHCIRLEKAGKQVRFLLDDFLLQEVSCVQNEVYPELYTQLCTGQFSAFSLTRCLQAQGEQLADCLHCETSGGLFVGDTKGVTYFTNGNAEGTFIVPFPSFESYEGCFEVLPYDSPGNIRWNVKIAEDTEVVLEFEKGCYHTDHGDIRLSPLSGHTLRVHREGDRGVVLLDRQCIYHGPVEGESCLSLRTNACLQVSSLEVIERK